MANCLLVMIRQRSVLVAEGVILRQSWAGLRAQILHVSPASFAHCSDPLLLTLFSSQICNQAGTLDRLAVASAL